MSWNADEVVYWCETDSPIGKLVVGATEAGVCSIDFGSWADCEGPVRSWAAKQAGMKEGVLVKAEESLILEVAVRELDDYFKGRRTIFDIPVDLRGTDFQNRVWRELMNIPYGRTKSYKDIAEAMGSPKAVRAVGGANNRNPLPIIVPCHRVIGANGDLVGYGGGLNVKISLLELEGMMVDSRRNAVV